MSVLPYLNTEQPMDERVNDLLSRMTIDEKISQMMHDAPAIERLGIPAYNWWNEALHGVARNGRATVFPQAIGMAATWNPALIQQVGSAIGDEGRAKYHEAVRKKGDSGHYQGLTFWSPNINIFRDPRWGRGQETYGEDPFLTGEIGAAYVRGIQGDDPKYLKAAACAKHYAVHSGPEKDRHAFDALVSQIDLHTTYLPAFKKLVTEAKVEAVMGAYNRTNGEPCCASQTLLVDLLRDQWGFEGHVVSDCGALGDIHKYHKVTNDAAETSALALKMGCDLSCFCTYDHLGEALERGLITEADIDRSLARTMRTRFKLGMFDPQEQVPYASIPTSVINCDKHRELAYQAALKSAVLLKNENSILPIKEDIRSILVVGPTAMNGDILLGNYYGLSDTMTTLFEGITGRTPEGTQILYRPGCQLFHPNVNPNDVFGYEVRHSDIVIACMGITPQFEGEEGDAILSAENGDRPNIDLPQVQIECLKTTKAAGGKIILIVSGGSPIALGEAAELADAILFVWYPGQEGGRAVASLLFGDESPLGKLPLTFPKSLDQLPAFDDYQMKGRTYRYMTEEPLYPFGFGLSYTQFRYSEMRLNKERVASGESVEASVTLTNIGETEAEEVAQWYLSDLEASVPVPIQSLIGFQRVRLKPGESAAVSLIVTPETMSLIDENGKPMFESGQFRLTAGGCSPGQRGQALGAPEIVSAQFTAS